MEVRCTRFVANTLKEGNQGMSYEGIRISEEFSESTQRAVGITPRRHETLGELVRDMAVRTNFRDEDPVSARPTRHEVHVSGEIFYTNCFGDALALPFVLRDATFAVRSESPSGGEVRATVTKGGVEASPPEAVVSVGAARQGDGPVEATVCPYINAFPTLADYERWADATPQAVTIALSPGDAHAVFRHLVSDGSEGDEAGMARSGS